MGSGKRARTSEVWGLRSCVIGVIVVIVLLLVFASLPLGRFVLSNDYQLQPENSNENPLLKYGDATYPDTFAQTGDKAAAYPFYYFGVVAGLGIGVVAFVLARRLK